jgi:hypothetical protein
VVVAVVTAEPVEQVAVPLASQELPITLVVELRQQEDLPVHPSMVFLDMWVPNMPVETAAMKAVVVAAAGGAAAVVATTVVAVAAQVTYLRLLVDPPMLGLALHPESLRP